MSLECASCDVYACRVGRVDATPDDCPMRGPFPSLEELYDTDGARRLLYHSALVEAEGYGRWTRVREIAELAHRMEYHRLGVVSCPDMGMEADLAARALRRMGLDVVVAAPFEDCDPVGQALLLAEEHTHFNVLAGMCVGHDSLFIRHSRAPVTSLVVRDLRLAHNPAAALYTREGYSKTALYGRREPPVPGTFGGWSDELIADTARAVSDAAAGRETPPCRVEEIMDFARRSGVSHMGIVFCVGFRREARDLEAILQTNGFRVSSSCCKTGAVPKATIGIKDEEQVTPGKPEMICNPVAQSSLLEDEGVELMLLLGQCAGHDSATMASLSVPAVCVVAKDRVLAHNTVAALYRP
ncbi:MAG: DUF1847 domain-containing protein [Gemmatimonadetes bacterium]|nr:DUF1847 domain-containing protein [Gemmatimonadota bacterium]